LKFVTLLFEVVVLCWFIGSLHWVFILQILGWNVMMERYVISVFEPGMICRSRRQEFAEIPVAQTSTKRYITFTITTRITIVALLS
jgi:hypothetical protein